MCCFELKVDYVFCGYEDDIITVGFADNEFNVNEYILLQKSTICDEQDKALGHDKVHITYTDELHSAYGGISKAFLGSNSLKLSLDKSTADRLGTGYQINIVLAENFKEYEVLKHNLQMIFEADTDVLVCAD